VTLFLRKFRCERNIAHYFTAIVLLCAVTLCSVGVPVVARTQVGKDTSIPFPCMHRACGCRNAAACWKSCCCFTNKQKLAWAQERNIQPPDYVVTAAITEETCVKSCCSKKKPSIKTRIHLVNVEQYNECQGKGARWILLNAAYIFSSIEHVPCTLEISEPYKMLSCKAERLSFAPPDPPPRCAIFA
jgi:hypothetical protein